MDYTLQRGRAQLSAETQREILIEMRTDLLQRGRAQLSAETLRPAWYWLKAKIASTGPRSIERGDSYEIEHVRKTKNASTGPRSIERGDNLGSWISSSPDWKLQRGRAQLSAETSPPLLLLPQRRKFRLATGCPISFNSASKVVSLREYPVYGKVFTTCERERSFPQHPATRKFNCQRTRPAQTT